MFSLLPLHCSTGLPTACSQLVAWQSLHPNRTLLSGGYTPRRHEPQNHYASEVRQVCEQHFGAVHTVTILLYINTRAEEISVRMQTACLNLLADLADSVQQQPLLSQPKLHCKLHVAGQGLTSRVHTQAEGFLVFLRN